MIFLAFVDGAPRQVIRLPCEIIAPSSLCSLVCLTILFVVSFFFSGRSDIFLRAFPTPEPLKWQSFLRRRPVEAKRGECSTGSSLDALRFSYAATSRCLLYRKNEKNEHYGLDGLLWIVIIYYGSLCRALVLFRRKLKRASDGYIADIALNRAMDPIKIKWILFNYIFLVRKRGGRQKRAKFSWTGSDTFSTRIKWKVHTDISLLSS